MNSVKQATLLIARAIRINGSSNVLLFLPGRPDLASFRLLFESGMEGKRMVDFREQDSNSRLRTRDSMKVTNLQLSLQPYVVQSDNSYSTDDDKPICWRRRDTAWLMNPYERPAEMNSAL
jgi:hypothetical protein